MPNVIPFVALVLMYFLLVYLFPIRKGRQPLLLWLLPILVQAASVFYFRTLCDYVARIPSLSGLTDNARRCVVIAILIVINLILIFLLNLVFYKEPNGDATGRSREEKLDMDSIQLNFTQEPMQNQEPSGDDMFSPSDDDMFTPSDDEMFTLSPDDMFTPEKPSTSGGVDGAEIFDSIQTMIHNGQTDEAIQYLRMIAYFGTNEALMTRAQEILQTMEKNS